MNFSKIFLPILLFVLTQAIEAQALEFTDVPSWVEPISPQYESTFEKYDINSGAYLKLLDYQYDLDEKKYFSHFATQVVNQSGVSANSEIYIAYDSSYQEVHFHYLHIWRDNEKLDRTKDLSFELINDEQQLNDGIYSGQVSAYTILDDVRKGDLLEYAYTLVGDNPIFGDHVYFMSGMEGYNPIDRLRFRFLYAKDKGYQHLCEFCDDIEVEITTLNDKEVMLIDRHDIKAFDYEDTSPTWHISDATISLSNSNGWQEVGDWANAVFEYDEEGVDIQKILKEIVKEETDAEKQIDKVIDFVQNDIRYMGVMAGIGSIKPMAPDIVFNQRFGDCKDKSQLLAALLNEIENVDAYPALVNTMWQHNVGQHLPGCQLFDHCIVQYNYKEKPFWVDPVVVQQGGDFRTKKVTDFGKALLIKEGVKALRDMEVVDEYSSSITQEFLRVKSFDAPAEFEVKTVLKGKDADYIRQFLEYYSKKELSEDFKQAYTTLFPSIELQELVDIKDDLKENIIVLFEKYRIPSIWRDVKEDGINYRTLQYEPIGFIQLHFGD